MSAKEKEGPGGEMLEGKPSHSRNLCAHKIADVQTLLLLAWSNHRGPFREKLEQLCVHVNSHRQECLLSDKLFHIEGEEQAGEKWQMLSRQQSRSGHFCIAQKREKMQAEIKLAFDGQCGDDGERELSACGPGQLVGQNLMRTFEQLS